MSKIYDTENVDKELNPSKPYFELMPNLVSEINNASIHYESAVSLLGEWIKLENLFRKADLEKQTIPKNKFFISSVVTSRASNESTKFTYSSNVK